MALRKVTTMETGVVAEYYRIDTLTLEAGVVTCKIGLYVNQEAAQSGKKPLVSQTIQLVSASYTKSVLSGENMYENAYLALKDVAVSDTPSVSFRPAKGLISGTFTDV